MLYMLALFFPSGVFIQVTWVLIFLGATHKSRKFMLSKSKPSFSGSTLHKIVLRGTREGVATPYPVNPGLALCLGCETDPSTKSRTDLGKGLVSLLIEQHPELTADQTIHLPEVSPENPSPVSPLLFSMWENLSPAPRDKPLVNVMSGGRSTETREIRRIIHEHSEHIDMFRNIHCYKDVKKVSTGECCIG